jgi:hypothetical protein
LPSSDCHEPELGGLNDWQIGRLYIAASPIRELFNHLVGAQQESFRDCYAKRFCRCKIDDELEGGRLFDRKVSGCVCSKTARARLGHID